MHKLRFETGIPGIPRTSAFHPNGAPVTYDYLIVGAGLSGATLAERLASDGKTTVLVADKRTHVAGNCYDPEDDGLRRHAYGPHIFHTNSADVFGYLSRFTRWRRYEHRVL